MDGQFYPFQPIQFLDGIIGRPPGFVKYTAHAVNFDGTNDYLSRGADLTGDADGKVGVFSAWIDTTSDNIGVRQILVNSGGFLNIRDVANKIQILGSTSAPVTVLTLISASSYTAASGWHHFLGSWNLATGQGQLYIDDVDDLDTAADIVIDDTIDYTRTDWAVGALVTAGNKLVADVADLMFWNDTSLDISVQNNRRLFIDENGRPVNPQVAIDVLGTPIIGLYGTATAGWETNLGDGGGFTENGALTDGGSSPSD